MNVIKTAKKIARGINFMYGTRLVINVSEFYGGEGNLIRLYVVKDAFYEQGEGYINKELFKSASAVYTVLFMRDLMDLLRHKEITDDSQNEGWMRARARHTPEAAYDYIYENYLMDIVEVDDENVTVGTT